MIQQDPNTTHKDNTVGIHLSMVRLAVVHTHRKTLTGTAILSSPGGPGSPGSYRDRQRFEANIQLVLSQ